MGSAGLSHSARVPPPGLRVWRARRGEGESRRRRWGADLLPADRPLWHRADALRPADAAGGQPRPPCAVQSVAHRPPGVCLGLVDVGTASGRALPCSSEGEDAGTVYIPELPPRCVGV